MDDATPPQVRTVAALVTLRAQTSPDRPALITESGTITYRELDLLSAKIAGTLVRAGVVKGTRVGVLLPNGIPWASTALAVLRIGAVLVPLSTLLTARELAGQLRTAAVQHLVSVDEFRGHHYAADIASVLPGVELWSGGPLLRPELPSLRRIWAAAALSDAPADPAACDIAGRLGGSVRPSDLLAIIFTSGSRGTPKGVAHSHGSALRAVSSGLDVRCVDADTRLYIPMPFFWVGGLGGGLMSTMLCGATLITEAVPEPSATLRMLERERATLFRGWPAQASALAHHPDAARTDLSALRPGSLDALLPPALRASQPGSRANLFGMTETFSAYSGYRLDRDMPAAQWGSCGRPFPGMDVAVIDPETGDRLPYGTTGEIHVRGPHVLREICRRSREEVFTADGYYPTGDLGHLDSHGFLFQSGRRDDMFKVKGASVYPAEVEAGLATIAEIRQVVVTRVDGPAGDEVGAVVVCDTGAVDANFLRARARDVLSAFKIPTRWVLLSSEDAVPRTATGKVDITAAARLLATPRHAVRS